MAKTYPAHARQEELINTFKEMTLLELSEFVKLFEETFDVRAAAPVAVTQVTEQAPAEEIEEQTEFTLFLNEVGDKKIQVIKEIHTITKLGLSDAKGFVEDLPKTVLENADRTRVEEARALLEK